LIPATDIRLTASAGLDGGSSGGESVLEMWERFKECILEIKETAHFVLKFLKKNERVKNWMSRTLFSL